MLIIPANDLTALTERLLKIELGGSAYDPHPYLSGKEVMITRIPLGDEDPEDSVFTIVGLRRGIVIGLIEKGGTVSFSSDLSHSLTEAYNERQLDSLNTNQKVIPDDKSDQA